MDKVDFYETHIFKYSRREGTKAAAMADQVPEQVKTARSARMIALGRRKQQAYEDRLIGDDGGSADGGGRREGGRRLPGGTHKRICESRTKNDRKSVKSVDKCRN